jgi:Group II intron, maturase-specific domain
MICNIVIDGLQDFIQDNLPARYKRSKEKLKYKLGKPPSSTNSHISLKVFCIRYADDILILGKCLKLHIKKIQSLLVTFLSQRGLEIKDASIFQGKRFKPGMSFDYLGFTFKYPNLDSVSFDKGKYTKSEFTPMNVSSGTLSKYSRSELYLLVKSYFLKKLKNSLKVQLSKKNSHLSVKTMVNKLNTILKGFLNYFSFTATIKKQLLPTNNLLHKLFYKYLLRKFSSVPKIYSFIKTNFINQNRFKGENKVLLKVSEINPLESVALFYIAPTNEILTANIYVDQDIIDRRIESLFALKRISKLG